MQSIVWALALVSMVGVILNIYKSNVCFMLWMFTNSFWMTIDFYKGIYPQSALFAVYTGLAVFGFIKWRKDAGCKSSAKRKREIP